MPKRSRAKRSTRKSAVRRSGKSTRTKALAPKLSRRRKKAQRPLAVARPQGRERVLALDVSSKCAGWAVFDDGQLVQHGRYIQVGKGHGQKLSTFREWIMRMLREFEPEQLIYEAPYSGRMRNTFGVLSRYAGMVECCQFDHFGKEMPPANAVAAHLVKKAIGAKKGKNHEENKKIVTLLVNQVFGLGLKYKEHDTTKKISQDDEADAIALNWAWHVLYRGTDSEEDE